MSYCRVSYCGHDKRCQGYGWEHDAQLTDQIRRDLGLPTDGKPISMKRAKRLMRAHRKELGDAEQ